MSNSLRPHRRQPTRLPRPWDSPGKNTGVGCHCLLPYLAYKCPFRQSYGFSSSHVQMWELGHKEDWAPKNWCFWTVVLEKTLENPLDGKIKPVNPHGNQPWIFTGRTDADAEAPILWPPGVKSWFVGKDPDGGKDWGRRKRGQQRMRWLDDITHSMDMSLSNLHEIVKEREGGMLQSKGSQRVGHDWATEQQQYPSTITSLHYKDQLNTEASYKLWNHHPPSTISKCNKNSLLFDC